MMKRLFKLFLVACALLSLHVNAKGVVVNLATVSPEGTPWAQVLQDVKNDIIQKSANKIEVKSHFGAQRGGESEIMDGVRRGRIQGANLTSLSIGAVVPEFNVLEIPFLFESNEEADFVLDQYLVGPFTELFAKKGLVFAAWGESGWRNIGLRSKLVKRPSDLESIKIRAQEGELNLLFWKKLKANPVPIAIQDVLSALQTGLVEGFDQNPMFIMSANWHNSIKFYTLTKHIYEPSVVLYSKKFMEGLKADDRYILINAGKSQVRSSRQSIRSVNENLLSVMKKQGITFYSLTDAERERFKDSVKGLEVEMIQLLGGDSQKIYDLILKAKAEFKTKSSKH